MKYPENHGEMLKDGEEPQKPSSLVCLNCGSNQFYEGPSGGMAVNVKCGGCGLWWNNTPFGFDFIGIKDNIGESKMIRWYCPHCNTVDTTEHIYGKYPHCPKCDGLLKVCWSYKGLPQEICDGCDARFPCYTTRGNFE